MNPARGEIFRNPKTRPNAAKVMAKAISLADNLTATNTAKSFVKLWRFNILKSL